MTTTLWIIIGSTGILGLVVLYALLRCKHDWEPLVEREFPSKAEELKKNGEDLSTWRSLDKLLMAGSKTIVAIISCKKCGAVKIFKVTT